MMKVSVVFLLIFLLNTVYADFLTPRIIDGKPVKVEALPWQVILKKSESEDVHCGGSVIANNWVLTAAHCTYGLKSVFLIFGTNNADIYDVSMTSTEIDINSDYNPKNLNNDISLIKLPEPLIYSETIQPINLVPLSESNNSFLGSTAIIAGFGFTSDEDLEFSDTLLQATVEIIDNPTCAAQYGSDVVNSSTMCAIGANSSLQSICSGDSGGPLITTDSNGNFIQIGINSFVMKDTCAEGFPSGYTRVTSFLCYIFTVTGLTFNYFN